MSELTIVADILVSHRGSLDTSELTRLTAAQEVLTALHAELVDRNEIRRKYIEEARETDRLNAVLDKAETLCVSGCIEYARTRGLQEKTDE
jgi:hypothetical protein